MLNRVGMSALSTVKFERMVVLLLRISVCISCIPCIRNISPHSNIQQNVKENRGQFLLERIDYTTDEPRGYLTPESFLHLPVTSAWYYTSIRVVSAEPEMRPARQTWFMKPAEMAAATTKAYSLGTVIVRDMVEFKIVLSWYCRRIMWWTEAVIGSM